MGLDAIIVANDQMSRIAKFLKVEGINIRELKKSQKVPLHDFCVSREVVSEPLSFLLLQILAVSPNSNQRDVQQSSPNKTADGIEKPTVIEIDNDQCRECG